MGNLLFRYGPFAAFAGAAAIFIYGDEFRLFCWLAIVLGLALLCARDLGEAKDQPEIKVVRAQGWVSRLVMAASTVAIVAGLLGMAESRTQQQLRAELARICAERGDPALCKRLTDAQGASRVTVLDLIQR